MKIMTDFFIWVNCSFNMARKIKPNVYNTTRRLHPFPAITLHLLNTKHVLNANAMHTFYIRHSFQFFSTLICSIHQNHTKFTNILISPADVYTLLICLACFCSAANVLLILCPLPLSSCIIAFVLLLEAQRASFKIYPLVTSVHLVCCG